MDEVLIAFLATLAVLVLIVLVSISVPVVSTFYFLHSDIAHGVRFGMWGWCLDDGSYCEGPMWGWTWDPNIIFTYTKLMVLYPIAAAFIFLAAVVLIPLFCYKGHRHFPSPFFSIFMLLALLCTILAYVFTIVLFVTARHRFFLQGFKASFGPAFWMALTAVILMILIAINTGCGSMCRGRFGRASRNIAYNV